jgi:hypothetical protein
LLRMSPVSSVSSPAAAMFFLAVQARQVTPRLGAICLWAGRPQGRATWILRARTASGIRNLSHIVSIHILFS